MVETRSIFLDLRQHVAGARDKDVRQRAPQPLFSGDLVRGVAIGVQIADGDGGRAGLPDRCDGGVERGIVERRQHRAVGAQAFTHTKPQLTRHQRRRRRRAQVVAVVLQPFAHFQNVAMAFGGEQRDLAPLRSSSALVATVAPCTMRCVCASVSPRVSPSLPASSSSPLSTPMDWSCGVDGDFANEVAPCSSMATRSVKVPPTSMPMVYEATSNALRSMEARSGPVRDRGDAQRRCVWPDRPSRRRRPSAPARTSPGEIAMPTSLVFRMRSGLPFAISR